ncbi:MAG: hypothetical protein AB1638_05085 [Nitrospirota bacterium]
MLIENIALPRGTRWHEICCRMIEGDKVIYMKPAKCTVCGNKTFQKDGMCVLCENGITKTYAELIELLKKDKKRDLLQILAMVETR